MFWQIGVQVITPSPQELHMMFKLTMTVIQVLMHVLGVQELWEVRVEVRRVEGLQKTELTE